MPRWASVPGLSTFGVQADNCNALLVAPQAQAPAITKTEYRMTWFKVDDKSAFHEKVIAAGDAAWGLLCRAGAWSSGHGTDGLVPSQIARTLCPLRSRWDALVRVELVYKTADGYVIRGFLKWNPSAEEVAKKRESRANAGRAGGVSSGNVRSKREAIASPTVEAPCFNKNEPPSRPVPSRPESEDPPVSPPLVAAAVAAPGEAAPSPAPQAKRGRPKMGKTACPSSDDPNVATWLDEHALPALSSKFGADVAKMLDWHRSNGKMMADWAATWRNWARSERAPHPVGPADGHAPPRTAWVEPEPAPFTFARPVDGPPVEPVGDLAALLKLASGL